MTLPYERTWALQQTREFLYKLLDPRQTPRVGRKIRAAARSLLKHYPTDFDLEQVAEMVPDIFGLFLEAFFPKEKKPQKLDRKVRRKKAS